MKRVLINPDGDKLIITDDKKEGRCIIEYEEANTHMKLSKIAFDSMMRKFEDYHEYFNDDKDRR